MDPKRRAASEGEATVSSSVSHTAARWDLTCRNSCCCCSSSDVCLLMYLSERTNNNMERAHRAENRWTNRQMDYGLFTSLRCFHILIFQCVNFTQQSVKPHIKPLFESSHASVAWYTYSSLAKGHNTWVKTVSPSIAFVLFDISRYFFEKKSCEWFMNKSFLLNIECAEL